MIWKLYHNWPRNCCELNVQRWTSKFWSPPFIHSFVCVFLTDHHIIFKTMILFLLNCGSDFVYVYACKCLNFKIDIKKSTVVFADLGKLQYLLFLFCKLNIYFNIILNPNIMTQLKMEINWTNFFPSVKKRI